MNVKQVKQYGFPGRPEVGEDDSMTTKLEQVECTEETYCERCGALLTHAVWMELDQRTNTFTATENEVPLEHSQGWFPFGIACANAERRLHEKAQEVRR